MGNPVENSVITELITSIFSYIPPIKKDITYHSNNNKSD